VHILIGWQLANLGYYFESMKRTRATFKLAVRYCKNNIEQIKADACAVSVLAKDCRKFWNSAVAVLGRG